MYVEAMLCDHDLDEIGKYSPRMNKSEDLMKKIKKYYQPKWFVKQKASWNLRYKPVFSEVLTKFGYGFTFNMLPKSKLFTSR
jgi:hypothetical protein